MTITYSQQAYGARAVVLSPMGRVDYVAGDMTAAAAENNLLLEDGTDLLLEDGTTLLLE